MTGAHVGSNFEWNDVTIALLTELWSKGISATEIGRRMGVGKNAVIGKAHRLKLPARLSPINLQKVVAPSAETLTIARLKGHSAHKDVSQFPELWAQGLLIKEIAARLEINRETVANLAKKLGLAPRIKQSPALVTAAKPRVLLQPPTFVSAAVGKCLWIGCTQDAFPVRPHSYCLGHRAVAYDRDPALHEYRLQYGLEDAA